MMIATTMNAATGESVRSSILVPGFSAGSGADIEGLRRRLQFANEPANITGLHWIGGYRDLFDVIAFRAVEAVKVKSRRSWHDARKHHLCLAFRAAEVLDCKQWNCG
jgi:hypothetical protein